MVDMLLAVTLFGCIINTYIKNEDKIKRPKVLLLGLSAYLGYGFLILVLPSR
jgi:hypothetical protein